MIHYEYEVRYVSASDIEKMANQMDENGWSPVTMVESLGIIVMLFKKERK